MAAAVIVVPGETGRVGTTFPVEVPKEMPLAPIVRPSIARAGPLWIATLPGRYDSGPRTASSMMSSGMVMLQELYTSAS